MFCACTNTQVASPSITPKIYLGFAVVRVDCNRFFSKCLGVPLPIIITPSRVDEIRQVEPPAPRVIHSIQYTA